jgi:hypothetical protein
MTKKDDRRIAALEDAVKRLNDEVAALRASQSHTDSGKTLTAPLRIADDQGLVRFEFSCSPSGPSLSILGANGKSCAAVGIEGEGGFLAIRNRSGTLVAHLDVESYGGRLQVSGNSKTGVVLFGGDADDRDAGIHALSSNGGSVSLWSSEHGGSLRFANAAGELVAGIGEE